MAIDTTRISKRRKKNGKNKTRSKTARNDQIKKKTQVEKQNGKTNNKRYDTARTTATNKHETGGEKKMAIERKKMAQNGNSRQNKSIISIITTTQNGTQTKKQAKKRRKNWADTTQARCLDGRARGINRRYAGHALQRPHES